MIDLILMASGEGVRFGKNKLLEVLNGKKLYEYALDLYQDIPQIDRKIVVSCHDEILHAATERGYETIYNPDSKKGISQSIIYGLKGLRFVRGYEYTDKASGIIFAVCDQPMLKKETVQQLISYYQKQEKGLVCLHFEGRHYSPRIFSYKYVKELWEVSGDLGGRQVIMRHKEDMGYLEVEDMEEIVDIDTIEDWNLLQNMVK